MQPHYHIYIEVRQHLRQCLRMFGMAFTYYALLAVLCTLVPLVVAQNFTVPQEWRVSD